MNQCIPWLCTKAVSLFIHSVSQFLLLALFVVVFVTGWLSILPCKCISEAEIIFKTMAIGILSPGRAFGVAQMMNTHPRYHATLKTKSTCHILLIYWHMMSGLIVSAQDLTWVEAMKQQAKKIYDAWERMLRNDAFRCFLCSKVFTRFGNVFSKKNATFWCTP